MKSLFQVLLILIFYIYFGYPIILFLISRVVRKKEYHISDLPTVSLIIAAYNEEEIISRKLKNSLALNYPLEKIEIIVAADGSMDRTKEIVESYKDRGVILSYSPQRKGKMAAISHACELAKGEILAFSDANNMYEEITFKYLVRPFGNDSVGGTTGAKCIYDENDQLSNSEGLYWKYESWIKKNESRLNTCTAAVGEIFAMKRSLYTPPPSGIINDDFYLLLTILKQGYKVVYVPEALSWERVSTSEKDEIVRRKRINAGRYQALFHIFQWLPWKNPLAIWQILSHKFLRLFSPFFLIFAFFSNAWLVYYQSTNSGNLKSGFLECVFLFFLIGQMTFYLLAVLSPFLSVNKRLKALYLPAFLVNSNYAMLQGFFSFIAGKQTGIWDRVKRRETK